MKRIFLSLALVTMTGSLLTFGATTAFFADTETSTANTFTAGAIDLMIDNESYYNGVFNDDTSWEKTDLTIEKFFDFDDLKPSDYGEDTISIHVDTNDAYVCADVTLTSNNENGCNEPEGLEDATCNDPGEDEGELAGLVNFIWWADDGDNVLEDDEEVISGPGAIGQLPLNQPYKITLADSETNIWNPNQIGGPIAGSETKYIGKAWCFGEMDTDPVEQDGEANAMSPAGDNNGNQIEGEPEDGGIICDGSQLGNESQTDSLTADVTFEAVQARHNDDFMCSQNARTTLTLVKEVIPSGPFNDVPTAWTLSAEGPTDISGTTGSPAVTAVVVDPGEYDLSEVGPAGYTASNWSCVGGDQSDGDTVNVAEGQNVVCTVTNFITCTPEERHADSVVESNQGVKKSGAAIAVDRTDPTKALGAPQSTGTPFDNPVVAGSFFSLGFDEGNDATPNEGGSAVFEFTNNYIVDGPGNDIRAWEVTGGNNYPVEKIKIEVSQNGSDWFVVTSSADRDTEADLADSGLTWASYIRITDVSDPDDFNDEADGYDLDAVSALTCASVNEGVNNI